MAMIRAMRMLNAIELGTTSGAELEILLTNEGRLAEFNVLLGMRGQARRMAASTTTMTAIVNSQTAIDALVVSLSGLKAIWESPIAATIFFESAKVNASLVLDNSMCFTSCKIADLSAVIASSTAMAAVAASSTAMAAVIASSTAMAAVAASSTAMAAVIASSTAMAAVIASSTAMAAVIASSTAMAAVIASSTAMAAIGNSTDAQTALRESPTALTALESVSVDVNSGSVGTSAYRPFPTLVGKKAFVLGFWANGSGVSNTVAKTASPEAEEVAIQIAALVTSYSRTVGFIGRSFDSLEVKTSYTADRNIYAKVVAF